MSENVILHKKKWNLYLVKEYRKEAKLKLLKRTIVGILYPTIVFNLRSI